MTYHKICREVDKVERQMAELEKKHAALVEERDQMAAVEMQKFFKKLNISASQVMSMRREDAEKMKRLFEETGEITEPKAGKKEKEAKAHEKSTDQKSAGIADIDPDGGGAADQRGAVEQ